MEVTSAGGKKKMYDIDGHGRIDGLPIRDIRNGFTAAYRADEKNVYHMYYALKLFDYYLRSSFQLHRQIHIFFD